MQENSIKIFYTFLKEELNQRANGFLRSLFRKTWYLFLIPFSVFIVIVIRLLRPIVLVRLGPLFSRRIGHFAINTELYLCRRDGRANRKHILDIFYHQKPICNHQLKKMWNRILPVSPFFRLTGLADRLNRKLSSGTKYIIPMPLKDCRDTEGLLRDTPAHIFFTQKEEKLGQRALLKMGVPEGAAFVCLHARDAAYLATFYPNHYWHNHNFRNCTIKNYIPAIEKLISRGYYVIRVGAIVKEPLEVAHPMIIDYATKYRTDFLDIYLSAKCRFFLGSGSGIDDVPKIFRRPEAYVNFIPLEVIHTWSPVVVFIPKKLWLRSERRFLAFREILDSGIGRFGKEESGRYEKLDLDIIENTPDEISDLGVEMDERVKGVWQSSEEDEDLQRCFWSLFKPSHLHGKIVSRIGAQFLRQNRQLLE